MQYKVVERSKAEALAIDVTALLAEGWKLEGGVSVCAWAEEGSEGRKGWQAGQSYTIYAQAMVLTEASAERVSKDK